MVDKENLVRKLESAGYDHDEATQKVEVIEKGVRDLVQTDDESMIMGIVSAKVDEISSSTAGASKFDGIVLAVGDRNDANGYAKHIAMSGYKENPAEAIRKGLVAVDDDGKAVPLDVKKFLDNAQTIPNGNFGKPLKTRMQKEIVTLVKEHGIRRIFGDYVADVGGIYSIIGEMKGQYLNPKGPGFIKQSQMDDEEFWSVLMEEIPESDLAADLTTVGKGKGPKKGAFIVTNGKIRYVGETSNGMMFTIIDTDDEMDDALVGFSNSETAIQQLGLIEEGNEVVAIAKVGSRVVDGETQYNLSAVSVIKNPSSTGYGDIMSQLDNVIY